LRDLPPFEIGRESLPLWVVGVVVRSVDDNIIVLRADLDHVGKHQFLYGFVDYLRSGMLILISHHRCQRLKPRLMSLCLSFSVARSLMTRWEVGSRSLQMSRLAGSDQAAQIPVGSVSTFVEGISQCIGTHS
jgi:hypothetical protein